MESSQPSVTLPQGQLLGITLEKDLPRPVAAFLGVPYALPPTGDRRFRPPIRVPESADVIDASRFGPAAPAKQLNPGVHYEYSEDCLTANVFLQQGPQATQDGKRLPVAVYIHGGAFNRGTSSMHNTASMVAYSEEPFIAVSFNYRVGALGFLPSTLSAKEGVLNLGLRDQVLLMEWVQENISRFGGDPKNVTAIGLSAGAHSIGHHMMSLRSGKPQLFHRAIIESGSPTSRAVRPYNAPIHEQQFKDFLEAAGVPADLAESEIFAFLRAQPSKTITDAQAKVFDKYNPSLAWAFQPVIDGDLIPRPPLESWRSGSWLKIPVMTGFNGNEGSLYVRKDMSQSAEFAEFFHKLLPLLPPEDLETVDRLYPDPATVPDSPYIETRDGVGAQYKRVEAAYGHYAYVAPVRQTAHLASAGQDAPVYLYHWALITSVLGGAQHADNMRYEAVDPSVRGLSESQKDLALTVHAYITSFITKGDPNAIGGRKADRPNWEAYKPEKPTAMLFGAGNEELIGGGVGEAARLVADEWARRECEFWWERVELSQQ